MKDGKMHGKGKIESDADVYQGDFKENMKDGQGQFFAKHYYSYSGSFVGDSFQGYGTLENYIEGFEYTGNFEFSEPKGKGKLHLKDKNITFDGIFGGYKNNVSSNLEAIIFDRGEAKVTYHHDNAGDDVFVGQFDENGIGEGEMTYANGTTKKGTVTIGDDLSFVFTPKELQADPPPLDPPEEEQPAEPPSLDPPQLDPPPFGQGGTNTNPPSSPTGGNNNTPRENNGNGNLNNNGNGSNLNGNESTLFSSPTQQGNQSAILSNNNNTSSGILRSNGALSLHGTSRPINVSNINKNNNNSLINTNNTNSKLKSKRRKDLFDDDDKINKKKKKKKLNKNKKEESNNLNKENEKIPERPKIKWWMIVLALIIIGIFIIIDTKQQQKDWDEKYKKNNNNSANNSLSEQRKNNMRV
jgi:hypothetical protein